MENARTQNQWEGLKGRVGAWALSSWPRRVWEKLLVGSAIPRFLELLDLTGDELVVEAGCGSGYYSLEVAGLLVRGKIICVDRSGPMLARLKRRTARAGLGPRVEIRTGDCMALPVSDGVADIASAHAVFHELTDPVGFARELFRVLRPGGRIAVTDFRDSARGKKVASESRHLPGAHGAFSPAELTATLREAGFAGPAAETVGDWVIGYGTKPSGS